MNNQLRDELLERVEKEQNLRAEWIDRKDDQQFAEYITEIDAQNTSWLEEVIKKHGLPGNSLVGQDGANAVFLIIQHSPDFDFQKRCLALMELAVNEGEMNAIHLAYLTDRVRLAEGRQQVYGTQGWHDADKGIMPAPIEDEEHVDERRKSIGLEPIAEYFKGMNELYKTNKGR